MHNAAHNKGHRAKNKGTLKQCPLLEAGSTGMGEYSSSRVAEA